MNIPGHRPPVPKFDASQMERTQVPFTQEDKGLYNNLPLVNTLRLPMHFTHQGFETTCDPPSFYEDDRAKWAKKFKASIAERERFKKKYLSDRAN